MIKKILFSLFLLFFLWGIFSLYRVSRHPERFQANLVSLLEERAGLEVSFDDAKALFTPFPILRATNLRMEFPREARARLTAEQAEFSFRLLPLLWGRLGISGCQIKNASGTVWKLPFENFDFKVRGLSPRHDAPFELRGQIAGTKEKFRGKGSVSFKNPFENLVTDWGMKADLTLQDLSLGEGTAREFLKRFAGPAVSGALTSHLRFEKEKGKNVIRGGVRFQLEKVQYESFPAFSLSGETDLLWDLKENSLELAEVSVEAPFGRLVGRSVFNTETGEIGEARLTGRAIVLEELIRQFPKLSSFLPLDTGFSGLSDFDLSVRGTLDYLGFHGSWNATSAILTFGKIFSKPKDLPMTVHFDLLLKKKSLVTGDFSVRVQQMTVKGALTDLDLATGEGELNLITNKFSLEGWNTLLTPFADYSTSGSAKILLNWKGNLVQLEKAQRMMNLTLEDARFTTPSGGGIRKANVSFDVSPLRLRVKESALEIGTNSFQLEGEIRTPYENPQPNFKMTSSRLEPFSLLADLRELGPVFYPAGNWRKGLNSFEAAVKKFLPGPAELDEFELTLGSRPNQLTLENLSFQLWGGAVSLRGERDWPSEKPNFWLEVTLDRIPLARYFEARGEAGKIFEGNLFANGRFQGVGFQPEEISKGLTGEGKLSLTNGEWRALDLSGPLKGLHLGLGEPLFGTFSQEKLSATPFYDLKAGWRYRDGKFDFRDFVVHNENLWVSGEGNLTPEGTLNGRLGIYLSKLHTVEFFKSMGKREDETQGKQLGPLPFLLVGSLVKPEVKPDWAPLERFLEGVRSRRFRRLLREPLKES